MASLLSLLEELSLEVLAFLPPGDLCRVSLACRHLRALVREELVWVTRARLETGLQLQPTTEFSVRQFYQNCLHRLGPLLGLWERTHNGYDYNYGGLLRLVYRDESIVAEVVRPGWSALEAVKWDVVLVVRAGRDGSSRPEVEQLDGFLYQLGGVPVLHPRLGLEADNLVLEYRALDVRRDPQGSPMAPGLFYGDCGDIINLQLGGREGPYLRGVWVAGRVAGEVFFAVSDPRCLDLSRQQQKTCRDIMECDKFVEYEEDKEWHFVLPDDYGTDRDSESFLEQQKTWRGRWVAEARFYGKPVPANFIKFNNDIFAVLTLSPEYKVTLFKRMSGV